MVSTPLRPKQLRADVSYGGQNRSGQISTADWAGRLSIGTVALVQSSTASFRGVCPSFRAASLLSPVVGWVAARAPLVEMNLHLDNQLAVRNATPPPRSKFERGGATLLIVGARDGPHLRVEWPPPCCASPRRLRTSDLGNNCARLGLSMGGCGRAERVVATRPQV